MNMNFMNQQDGRSGSQTSESFSEAGGASEQEFNFTEEKKPVNRNAIVLLVIALVGGGLVYYMYARGAAAVPTESAEVSKAIKGLEEIKNPLKEIEANLAKTSSMVASFQETSAEGQIPVAELKTNPFAIDVEKAPIIEQRRTTADNPLSAVRAAAAKVKVQTILYSSTNSTCFVNSKIYAEGQTLSVDGVDFTIRSIKPDMVVLHNRLGQFEVALAGKNDLSK